MAPDGTFYSDPGALWATNPGLIPSDNTNVNALWDNRLWWEEPVYDWWSGVASEPVVATDGTIIVALETGYDTTLLVGFNPTNGGIVWTLDDPAGARGGSSGELALDSNGNICVADPQSVFSFASGAGSLNWFFDYPTSNPSVASNSSWGFTYAGPVVGADGTVYVNSDLGQLFALNGTNGSLKWVSLLPSGQTNGLLYGCSPAIGYGGILYFGAANYFFGVNPTNGSYLWTFRPSHPDEMFAYSPVVGGDGTVYVHTWSPGTNRLYALNPATGVARWTNVLRATTLVVGEAPRVWSKGTLALAADGEIYVGDIDNTVYSFAPNGSRNWTYVPGGGVYYAFLNSLLIAPDGTLFVGDGESGGSALTGPAPLACAPWPEYRKNNRRTAAVAPPTIGAHLDSPAMTTSGFQFTVTAATNSTECICASRNLVTWTNLGQVVLTNGPANFVDTGASNYQYRFYRSLPQ